MEAGCYLVLQMIYSLNRLCWQTHNKRLKRSCRRSKSEWATGKEHWWCSNLCLGPTFSSPYFPCTRQSASHCQTMYLSNFTGSGEAAEGQDAQLRRVTLSRCEQVVQQQDLRTASHFTSHAAHIIFPIKANQKKARGRRSVWHACEPLDGEVAESKLQPTDDSMIQWMNEH